MTVNCKIEDGIAHITMDDGKVNALSGERLGELSAALKQAKNADAIAFISGRPGIFSAGFDMNVFALGEGPSRDMLSAGIRAIVDILAHPRPVVTFCTGHAYPMGAFLMLAADLRLGLNGDFKIGMNETAIKIDVPDFALALANARLTPAARTGIPVARMFSPEESIAAGYLDFIAQENDCEDLIGGQLSALQLLDHGAFRSTKARQNNALIKAINKAGVPDSLTA
ncbi:crotonase/enoyl-CoA hydratase family protein [Parasphingorhabdus halotolerans]|uniref:Crotonase/enoyl-CoA hydratase family protein n=1 Tax=Parasphingorhabdus halotolerans TaxID=2725558 RepID=A0A6H2DQI1_9SPHN|nr:crotonase/enoyl-CoA hydratase family protein [Parasphingorhabdus halotolerans]QJB69926.1 crotonase/enoyl-CoA hydratase family protein [Parasphingorhabdus halotolerans]